MGLLDGREIDVDAQDAGISALWQTFKYIYLICLKEFFEQY